MCLNTRGLVRSVIRRIVPPLPAESRPSNTTQTFAPVALTHSCMATSSPCRTRISFSYSLAFIFGWGAGADVKDLRRRHRDVRRGRRRPALPCFLAFFDFLPIGPSPLLVRAACVSCRH